MKAQARRKLARPTHSAIALAAQPVHRKRFYNIMKTKHLIIAAASLLLTGCCTAHRVAQWEYRVAKAPHIQRGEGSQEFFQTQEKFLDELGANGWMLVTQQDGVYYLRRAKR